MAFKKKIQKRSNLSSQKDFDDLAKDEEARGLDRYSGRRRWTVEEVMNAVIMAASEKEAAKRLKSMAPSKLVIRAATARLKESETHETLTCLLDQHAADRGFPPPGTLGKRCPKTGDSRTYIVQASRRGPKLYIPLPVNCLTVAAGDRVVAVFGDKGIQVEPEAG